MRKPDLSSRRSSHRAPRYVSLACAVAALSAGCVDTVSLGSGDGETEEERPAIPIVPWLPSTGPVWQDIDEDLLHCKPDLETDLDEDGFTPAQGDCNDCDPDVGPNAVEMPTDMGPAKDENCDGLVDEPLPICDAGIPVDTTNPHAAARALDLCADARKDIWGNDRWGIEEAAWVLPDGTPELTTRAYALGHGVLDRFGPNVPVRRGARMLALSSGTARQPTDPDYEPPRGYDKGFTCAPPAGFPQAAPSCPGVPSGAPHDGIALELTLRAPQNAEAFAFDYDFYTYELPDHFCTSSNDLFVALLHPPPSSAPDANIAFDAAGNLVSVNTVLLEACSCPGGPPCLIGGRQHACALGSAPLLGTGFGNDLSHEGDRGATGWLTTTADIARGGTITLRFSIHDAANGYADSTVLIDHFRWLRREPIVPKSRRD